MSRFPIHKVFISYHHRNDWAYKEALTNLNKQLNVFIDMSVDTGDIDPSLNDEYIRTKIRDEYLRDSSVTVLLVGEETARRKHIDWELYSSMIDGKVNSKSGIVVVQLPTIEPRSFITAYGDIEKKQLYPEITGWIPIGSRSHCEGRYPYLPDRIIDQVLARDVKVSVTQWSRIYNNFENLALLIDCAYRNRANCCYDLSRPMKIRDE